jgi:DNA-binding NarL/FixJ family response regulator
LLLANVAPADNTAAEHYGFLAATHYLAGDFAGAHAVLQRCLQFGTTVSDHAVFSYHTAFALWIEGKPEEAESYVEQCVHEPKMRTLAMELHGWIASARQEYVQAVERFHAALASSMADSEPDMHLRAKILWALTHIACEMYLPHLLEDIRAGLASLPDTQGIRVPKMHACRYTAWCHAVSGDFSEAFRLIRMAARLCGEDAWKVTALCERANLALSVYGTAEEYIAEARECADSVSWLETHSEERVGLLYLANLLARTDILAARSYLETYNALAPTSPDMAHDKDVCARAFEAYVNACIDQMSGDYVSASANYAKAYAIYRKAGYVWRAILAAVGKADLAGGSKTYAEYAADQLRRFPNSWLRSLIQEKLAELPVRSSAPTFTAMQMEIMRGICAGKTDKEIAEQICRSYATVRHHLHHLRELTGAKNRADLAAYCARKGLLDRQD